MKTKLVNKSEIKNGDTLIVNGELRTVDKQSIVRDEFLGLLLFADSYCLGYLKVELVVDVKF
ncbi:hypothetical protein HOS16_gp69 [Shigella phage vB_SflS-ISF001]|uniref:Uncharacterized protein n=1 Tax=Shigella phage vB_SflS-ISF001 TaxID=2048005 RepID=A0A2D1GQ54_9CAUD|nr:hypothetical protein HOS16_gp69 [Shigella phage vB_SflS-ISF001]ATN94147.1 hypothetical protein FLXISF001_069 [Shigella phage vB_SflS-ISF001]